jgi:hypothetical protein
MIFVDNESHSQYLEAREERGVRRRFWMFAVVLACAVFCASAIPPTDVPETSYDETDTPVNQAPPVVQGMRIVKPPLAVVILAKKTREAAEESLILAAPAATSDPSTHLSCPDRSAVLRI